MAPKPTSHRQHAPSQCVEGADDLRAALLCAIRALSVHVRAQIDLAADGCPPDPGWASAPTPREPAPESPAPSGKRQSASQRLSEAQAQPRPPSEGTWQRETLSAFSQLVERQNRPVELALGDTLTAVQESMGECTRCKLHEKRNRIVFGEGAETADLLFIGEGPGAEEDRQGRPFVGKAGQLLTKIISAMGVRREDVYITNVVKCRPPRNRDPESEEVAACESFLLAQIQLIRPKIIVTLGRVAAQALLRIRTPITRLRGNWQDYHGIPVMPTLHPAYLLRQPPAKRLVWRDVQDVMGKLAELS